jgi:hypothetical protein
MRNSSNAAQQPTTAQRPASVPSSGLHVKTGVQAGWACYRSNRTREPGQLLAKYDTYEKCLHPSNQGGSQYPNIWEP